MNHFPAASSILALAHWHEDHCCQVLNCEHTGWNCDSPACSNMVCGVHNFKCPYCAEHFCPDCSQAHYEACGEECDVVADILKQRSSISSVRKRRITYVAHR